MPIVQQGAINTTALVVPDLYVQIIPPQVSQLNGVPTNILGIVGTAAWGPVNQPVIIGTMSDYAAAFGPVQNRTYDLGTAIALAVLQGANNFRCVRVTDGTDTHASVQDNTTTPDITFTSLYTGSLGNQTTVTFSIGGATGSWNVTVGIPGLPVEQFTNITGTGNAFWLNVAAAITVGQGPLRGPSKLITAVADAGTAAPAAAIYTLAGGTDGVSTITGNMLVGTDTIPRTGMYALRGQGCSLAMLADETTVSTFTTQVAFGLSEGIYMIGALAAGTTVSAAINAIQSGGSPSYALKVMHGDWLYWYDTTNGVTRLVSPQGFVAGRLANLSPEQSSLNKPLYGIIGSQSYGLPNTGQANHYADADLQALFSAGIDVITNPIPLGLVWGVRGGINSSLNAAVNGDNYTRLTNYIASTLNAGMGQYIGQLIDATTEQNAKSTISAFLFNMWFEGMLGTYPAAASPYSVICDASNNPFSRTSLGYMQANVNVTYAPINRFFLVNLQGGQSVQISSQPNA